MPTIYAEVKKDTLHNKLGVAIMLFVQDENIPELTSQNITQNKEMEYLGLINYYHDNISYFGINF